MCFIYINIKIKIKPKKQYRRHGRFFPDKLFRQVSENVFGKFRKEKATFNFTVGC